MRHYKSSLNFKDDLLKIYKTYILFAESKI